MARNFTLRDVGTIAPGETPAEACDLVFHGGRLANLRAAPEGRAPQIFLTPGFWDAHIHLLHVGLRRQRLDLSESASLADALAALAQFARDHAESPVLWAEGWDESVWPEARLPEREELDAIVADRIVVMRRVCGHLSVLNSRGLAGAAVRWSDLPSSGVLTEERAMGLAAVWPPTPSERDRALREAQEAALRLGILRVSEMGSEGSADAYLSQLKHGTLKLDVDLYFKPTQIPLALRLRQEGWLTQGRLHLGGVKAFADGSIGARTAALRAPYADRDGSGTLLLSGEELSRIFEECVASELPLAVHAIGDAAIEQVIGAAEEIVRQRGERPPHGWASLEHAELLDDELLERAVAAGLRFSMQPNFIARWGQPGGLYETALGPERWRRLNPLRRVRDAEGVMVFGSDGMPMDPALGLRGAAAHPVESSRLSADEALRIYLGTRLLPIAGWGPDGQWETGCRSFALHDGDPRALAGGDAKAAPVRGVLRDGEWLLPPAEELQRRGAFHVD
jgi:predicted amidohydrolase YtcJ